MTYLSSRVEFELMIPCLIIHGLNKDIHYHEKNVLIAMFGNHWVRCRATHNVGSQRGDYRHFCLLRGFLWVCMG